MYFYYCRKINLTLLKLNLVFVQEKDVIFIKLKIASTFLENHYIPKFRELPYFFKNSKKSLDFIKLAFLYKSTIWRCNSFILRNLTPKFFLLILN